MRYHIARLKFKSRTAEKIIDRNSYPTSVFEVKFYKVASKAVISSATDSETDVYSYRLIN